MAYKVEKGERKEEKFLHLNLGKYTVNQNYDNT